MTLEDRKKFVINQKKKNLIIEIYESTLENESSTSIKSLIEKFGSGLNESEISEILEKINKISKN